MSRIHQFHIAANNIPKYICILLVCCLSSCHDIFPGPMATPTPTLEASLMDTSLLTDQPCSAPCWYGLELGISNKAEIKKIIGQLSFLNIESISEGPDPEYLNGFADTKDTIQPVERIDIDCKIPQQRCVSFFLVNQKLTSIWLIPNFDLTLKDVIDHLGAPDYIRPGREIERPTCILVLSWEAKRIQIWSRTENGWDLCSAVFEGKEIPLNPNVDWIRYELLDAFTFEREWGTPWIGFSVR